MTEPLAEPFGVPMISLNNGVEIPAFGLGVWQVEDGNDAKQAILTALAAGYRLIDTAKVYGNERSVGEAIRESGLPRDELFITTKLWNTDQGFDAAIASYDASLERLGLDYVDLYLIHWPVPRLAKYVETWRSLEQLYKDKRVRAIGVSNFHQKHLEDILAAPDAVVPAVNQVELHPHFQQSGLRKFCEDHGIQIESYSPLKRGGDILSDETVTDIAAMHGKTAAQIVLRWHVQEGLVVIPKSVTPERIKSNIEIFEFELTDEEMQRMRGLDREERVAPNPDSMNVS